MATPSFTCAAVGCYSLKSPETHALFKELQSYLNRFARAVGFPLLAVDGILGTGTATAAQKVATAMSRSGASPMVIGQAPGMIGIASSPASLAQGAVPFVAFLKAAAGDAQLPPVAAPSTGSGGGSNLPVSTAPAPGAFDVAPPKTVHKAYYAAGALIGGAVLFGLYHLFARGRSLAGPEKLPGSDGRTWWDDLSPAEKRRFRAEQRAWEAQDAREQRHQRSVEAGEYDLD